MINSLRPPRILLADAQPLLLDAFRALLQPALKVVAAVSDGHALVEAAIRLKPDIILTDLHLPGLNGLDACELLKKQHPKTKVLFLTANEATEVASEAIRRGAAGYIVRKAAAQELFKAIAQVLSGHIYISPFVSEEPTGFFVARARKSKRTLSLTRRQRAVLQSLAEGKSMKQAADVLNVTTRTIAFHKYQMMDRLGFKSGAELVCYAARVGLVGGQSPLRASTANVGE